MTKTRKILIACGAIAATAAIILFSQYAGASGGGFDLFGPMRVITLTNNTTGVTKFTAGTATSVTDNPVLIRTLTGVVQAIYSVVTNAGTDTFYIIPQTSPDTTNWSVLSNYAVGYATSETNTNTYYAGGAGALITSNFELLPGIPTTPTASTAGFATPYNVPQQFTNSGNYTNGGVFNLSWDVNYQGPYFRTIYWSQGTNSVTGVIIGQTSR